MISLISCTNQINVFKTATSESKSYRDTLVYDNNKFIVLPIKVNGETRKMMFDTGADLVVFPKDSSTSKIKCNLRDANGNVTLCDISPIDCLEIANNNFTGLFSFKLDLPAPFLCFCDGIIGNNVIKSCNWLIDNNKVVFSDNAFDIPNKRLSLDIFYYGSNRLFSNLEFNGNQLDTCLFDYGGLFDIELSKKYYEKNKESFYPNKITREIRRSYGANGKTLPDTVLNIDCNINFNGIKIDNANIIISNNYENRFGVQFLRRFEKIAINNINGKMLFGNLIDTTKHLQQKCLFSFDLINGFFVIDSKILDELKSSKLNVGDKFIEINNRKRTDFKNYCDFLVFKDSLNNSEYVELKTITNRTINIDNWR